ncbi:RidA family protein [Pyramidobacter sp. SM-530-WT-4B]|uniref:RidA family protein n=1 Tax=Pyramidobacter porci TaxID=2605789 RepID=A0A6L5YCA6_9BACT|nr:RidA family protein [Pyramidobacter porci]MCI6260756.1 RidA family protein [Pyramidobacter sp.]MDY2648119.1 RidA family protein [Pyramidobacter porci]MST55966.1 RidA family protein [Pyramidobacter porci]
MSIKERLKELGIELPPANKPTGSYVPATASGTLCFSSGQTPRVNGEVAYTGTMGAENGPSLEEAYAAARVCAINCLAAVDMAAGLDNVARVLKVTGFINAAPGFTQTAKVLNGASDLLLEVFAQAGRHARSAIGIQALPGNAVVEVEIVVRLKEPREFPAD